MAERMGDFTHTIWYLAAFADLHMRVTNYFVALVTRPLVAALRVQAAVHTLCMLSRGRPGANRPATALALRTWATANPPARVNDLPDSLRRHAEAIRDLLERGPVPPEFLNQRVALSGGHLFHPKLDGASSSNSYTSKPSGSSR